MKANKIDNNIKIFNKIPSTWNNILNFNKLSEQQHQQHGFYDLIKPDYNKDTQKMGNMYFDEQNNFYTYEIIDLTEEQLHKREEPYLSRKKAAVGETIPYNEQLFVEPEIYQIRYNFRLGNITGETSPYISGYTAQEGDYFYFDYKNFSSDNRDDIINSIIREKYTQDKSESILRKKLSGDTDSFDFLKFNNWVTYAKAIADGNDLEPIKNKQVYKIVIPLELCEMDQDYGGMTFNTIIRHITFVGDPYSGIGTAYPSYIFPNDLVILESDPRVTITQMNLFE